VGALIGAHGFFVAGEFALVAVDRTQIQRLAREGDRRARSTLEAVKSLSFQLSGAQLGITLTSLVLGFIVEPTLGEALEPIAAAIGVPEGSAHGAAITAALVLATAAEMVLGELIPKNVAIARPLPVALNLSQPFRLANRSVRRVILWLNGAANWSVRRLGIEPLEELAGVRSLEELQMLVHSSRAGGLLRDQEFSLLERSLRFPNKRASDALIPRTSIRALPDSATLADLGRLALESGHSRFPVFREGLDDIIGIAHVKDSYSVEPARRAATPVTEAMRVAMVVPESRPLEELLIEMRRQRQHLAVVIDEFGGTAGIITLEDLLEEIVGNIEDEYDPSTPQLTVSPAGIHVVSGMLHPDEVRDVTGLEIPEGQYETLAGFLLALLDRVPEQGDHATYKGWELKVVEMDRRRIAQVLLVAPSHGTRAEVHS
jgi:CBS domain containing-hemolysin-like protein